MSTTAEATAPVDKRALGITEGRIVHYQFERDGKFFCRPAIIVNALVDNALHPRNRGEVGLRIFLDDTKEAALLPIAATDVPLFEPHLSATSSSDEMVREAGTWHFPER